MNYKRRWIWTNKTLYYLRTEISFSRVSCPKIRGRFGWGHVWSQETRPSHTCITMPNLVALGQIIRASVWVSKILQMVGLCPLVRGISDPLETLHFPTLYVAEFGRPRSNSQCLITQILRTDTETKHGKWFKTWSHEYWRIYKESKQES